MNYIVGVEDIPLSKEQHEALCIVAKNQKIPIQYIIEASLRYCLNQRIFEQKDVLCKNIP